MSTTDPAPKMVCVPCHGAARVSTVAHRVTTEGVEMRISFAWISRAEPASRRGKFPAERWVQVY
jgi:hypothetical protein